MVVLAVTWKAKPGKEAEMAAIFRNLEAASRREAGCLLFVAHQHRTELGRFFVYEQYVDDGALEEHRNSEYFHEYVGRALSGIGDRLQGELYTPLTDGSSK